MTIGMLFWMIKNLDNSVKEIKDKHLKDIAKDITEIKIASSVNSVKVDVLEEQIKGMLK